MNYNRPSVRVADDEQDYPAATLKDFVRYHITRGTDYATAYAKACDPYFDLDHLDDRFDREWKRQGGK